jgi:hypothetical protein
MIALLKKDWRLYRAPIVGGIIIVLLPYFIGAIVFFVSVRENPADFGRSWILGILSSVSGVALCVTVLIGAIFGGVAFAQERRERWAEFLSILPARRHHIVLSKIVLSVGFIGALWAINTAVYFAATSASLKFSGVSQIAPSDVLSLALAGTACVMAFGVAWSASSGLSSPAIAVGISVAATVVSLIWPTFIPRDLLTMSDEHLLRIMIVWTAAVGMACTIGGTAYFMRRVEP